MADPIRVPLQVSEPLRVPLGLESGILPKIIEGVSPEVSLEETADGVVMTVTDKTGTETALIPKGEPGQQGDPGQPGEPGQPGNDGVSPTISVADITGGHRVTITDATGERSFDVMDGSGGAEIDDTAGAGDTDVVWSADKSSAAVGAKYTKPIGGIPASDMASGVIPAVPVQDVQVNGTSILSNGVANVPIGQNRLGVVKQAGMGVVVQGDGALRISVASNAYVKAGSNEYTVIAPVNQHRSAFYGLAKAAGADMASSSNPVGTYTDAAQGAIRKMLCTPGNSDIAYIETGVVAQRAYKAGEYFVDSDGILSKATDAIASGGSLVLDTNYEHVGGQGGLANDLTAPAELVGSVTFTGDDVPTGSYTVSVPLSKPCKHLTIVITNGTENIPSWSYLRLNYAVSSPCLQVRAASNHKYALCIIDLINKYGITYLKPTNSEYADSSIGGTSGVSQHILNNNVAKEVGFKASGGYAEGFSIKIYGR